MDIPAPRLYLDPLLPVTVRRDPVVWPVVPYPSSTTLLLVVWAGDAIAGPDRASPGSSPYLVWPDADSRVFLRSLTGWLIVLGNRVVQDISVASYGEPGFCRFLGELSRSGWCSLGTRERREIDRVAADLLAELTERPAAYRARVRGLLSDLLLLVYRGTLDETRDAAGDGAYRLSDVIDYIENNYADDVTLAELAAIPGCSASYLSRVFSREVGVPPLEYVNRVRIRHACELLRATEASITEVAFQVGYHNLSFFNRYFRRVMLRTPREYRRYVSG